MSDKWLKFDEFLFGIAGVVFFAVCIAMDLDDLTEIKASIAGSFCVVLSRLCAIERKMNS